MKTMVLLHFQVLHVLHVFIDSIDPVLKIVHSREGELCHSTAEVEDHFPLIHDEGLLA